LDSVRRALFRVRVAAGERGRHRHAVAALCGEHAAVLVWVNVGMDGNSWMVMAGPGVVVMAPGALLAGELMVLQELVGASGCR
jgi:hypothetical protein